MFKNRRKKWYVNYFINATYLDCLYVEYKSVDDVLSNNLGNDVKEIFIDQKIIYKITFDSYIGFHILNESCSSGDDSEQFTYGNLIRVPQRFHLCMLYPSDSLLYPLRYTMYRLSYRCDQ